MPARIGADSVPYGYLPVAVWEQKAGVQWIGALVAALLLTGFYKRFRWAPLKVRPDTTPTTCTSDGMPAPGQLGP